MTKLRLAFLRRRRCLGGFLCFLLLLICIAQSAGAFLCFLALLVELCFLISLAIHLGQLGSFDQQISFVRPGGFAVRIQLDGILDFLEAALRASLRRVEIFLVLRLLVSNGGAIAGVDGGRLVGRKFRDFEGTVPVFARQDRVGFGALFRLGAAVISSGLEPGSQFLVVLNGAVKVSNGFVGFFALRIFLQNLLVSLDGLIRLRNIFGSLDAGPVLRVNGASDEKGCALAVGIEFEGPS